MSDKNSSVIHSPSSVIRSYGRRRGRKLRTTKQSLIDELLPQVQLKLQDVEIGRGGDVEKLFSSLFPHIPISPHPHIFLEIGFGGGEHLIHQATQHPHVGFIGCEPYVNGIAGLLSHIHEHKVKNIRVFADDVRTLLAEIPDATFSRVFIYYPDPWPKARHHKRRLISQEFLDVLARVMQPGSELRLATDWEDYATWMLEHLLTHPEFSWTAKNCDDWLKPPADWLSTRYEQKALAEGRIPTYLTFIRK